MEELIQKTKVALADTVAFGMKAHQFHWNVEGADFYQYHLLLQRIYEEVEEATDAFGEQVRTLDAYAPLSPQRIASLTTIEEGDVAPMAIVAIRVLYNDNNKVLSTLTDAYREAERYSEFGLSNFLQDRITAHKTHQYLLRSTLKGAEQ